MKKNLFDTNLDNSSNANGLHTQKACKPCALECEKINKKINNRKLSNLKDEEIAHIFSPFNT